MPNESSAQTTFNHAARSSEVRARERLCYLQSHAATQTQELEMLWRDWNTYIGCFPSHCKILPYLMFLQH